LYQSVPSWRLQVKRANCGTVTYYPPKTAQRLPIAQQPSK